MSAYYNEIDPFAAEWLRGLIDAGHIAPGVVDTRSITEVSADDLAGFDQCHFFAGIGGWSLAARLAGIPDDYPLWTGSCPCQPFSVAGRQRGADDERHLWPVFRDLIAECRPAVVAGEQVASKAGRAWLSGVLAEVEGLGYAGAGADLCAAGVGAPHIRQRLYWVAFAEHVGREGIETRHRAPGQLGLESWNDPDGRCVVRGGLGHADGLGAGRHGGAAAGPEAGHGGPRGAAGRERDAADASGADRGPRGLGDALGAGLEGLAGDEPHGHEPGRLDAHADRPAAPAGGSGGPWADVIWLPCGDGKSRPIEPGIAPVAHGVPGRVGRVRAYGNAILPHLAADFLIASLEAAEEAFLRPDGSTTGAAA